MRCAKLYSILFWRAPWSWLSCSRPSLATVPGGSFATLHPAAARILRAVLHRAAAALCHVHARIAAGTPRGESEARVVAWLPRWLKCWARRVSINIITRITRPKKSESSSLNINIFTITVNSYDQPQCHSVFTVTTCRRRMVDLGLVFLCSCGIGAMHRGSMGANSADFPGSLAAPGWRSGQDDLLGGRVWSWSWLCWMDFDWECLV